MPILHLDARADLVQCIKLCEAIAGRGSALTRPPRLALPEADRVMWSRSWPRPWRIGRCCRMWGFDHKA